MNLKTNRATASLLLLPLLLLGVSVLQAQSEPLIFTPNSISLFWPGTNAGAANGYFGEWELQNNMPVISGTNAGLDVNIMGAWSNGFTGQGVTIAIVDSGVQGTHPDLNYATNLSWNFFRSSAQNLTNPNQLGFPIYPTDTHGTECAGIAAGTGETFGIVGAAPDAMVASFRFLDPTDTSGKSVPVKYIAWFTYQGQRDAKGNPNPYLPVNWKNPAWKNGPPIRVKSCSFSPQNEGYRTDFYKQSDLINLSKALSQNESNGIITLFCAGNARAGRDTAGAAVQDANRLQIQADPHMIIVGAINSAGKHTSYSSFGANLFVVAPSNEPNKLFYSIPTTDLVGIQGDNSQNQTDPDSYLYEVYFNTNNGANPNLLDYWSCFGGTSSATPLVAGIMALGVQANPFLNSRMARYLLALTSRQVDPSDDTFPWITNAAGYRFNNDYGFGLVDATAFTTAAAYAHHYQQNGGKPLSAQQAISANKDLIKAGAYFATPRGVESKVITATLSLTNKFPGLKTEYVQVEVGISGFETNTNDYARGIGAIAGDISGQLISPSGTTNTLFITDQGFPLNGRAIYSTIDKTKGGVLHWKYLSYAYWGENPNGTWKLNLVNNSTNATYTNNLSVDFVNITAGVGSFDTNCLGTNFPLSNGPNRVAP